MTCLSFSSVAPEYLVSPPNPRTISVEPFFPRLGRRLAPSSRHGQRRSVVLDQAHPHHRKHLAARAALHAKRASGQPLRPRCGRIGSTLTAPIRSLRALTQTTRQAPRSHSQAAWGLSYIRAWYLLHNDFPAANDVDTLRQSTEAGSIAPHHCAGNGIDIIGRDLCHLCLRDLGGDGQQSGGRL